MAKRAVKSSATPIPITTSLNISALAREHGVSRKTIQRRLASGWRPDAHPPAPTPAQAHGRTPGRGRAVKDQVVPVWRTRTPPCAPMRPPLGVVRTVLLILAVAFYGFIACAALGVRG